MHHISCNGGGNGQHEDVVKNCFDEVIRQGVWLVRNVHTQSSNQEETWFTYRGNCSMKVATLTLSICTKVYCICLHTHTQWPTIPILHIYNSTSLNICSGSVNTITTLLTCKELYLANKTPALAQVVRRREIIWSDYCSMGERAL